ncbi:uncharacterized protein B0H64DRAFT_428024 [Chaetomium fimeti]|uniref:BTB domain-containing protein n=1 Tax=Chaetomium fimeti TaxID=1854472 RepID=A0AAE0HP74_9PEZI|nr:hypothetical protein B0H64DRAFT_428024 [Chaetomium fimeti]
MGKIDFSGNGADRDSDSDRPAKRLRAAATQLDALGSANSTAPAINPFSSAREVPVSTNPFGSTDHPLFGRPGLSNLTPFGTSASQPRPETSSVPSDFLADNAAVAGSSPRAETVLYGLHRAETVSVKHDESTTGQEGGNNVGQEPGEQPSPENGAEIVQPKTEEDAVTNPIESFDDHGNLTLIVGKANAQVNFRVCSYSLRRVSARWHDLLYGPSSDPKDREGLHGWVVRLPEDDPEAMRIVLRVVHGDLSNMPVILSQDALSHLTALCERHNMVGLLKPFWGGWVDKLPEPTLDPTIFQHLGIAKKLGHLQRYMNILIRIRYSSQKRPDGRLCLESHPDVDLYNDPYLQKLGILKPWENGRLRMLHAVSIELRAALDKLLNPAVTNCCSSKRQDWQQTCDCAMLGGVYRALHGKHWYSGGAQNWEQSLTVSVRQLVAMIDEIRTAAVGDSRMRRKQGDAHMACTPWTPICLTDIIRMSACEISPSGKAYFERRAKKSGLDVLAPEPYVIPAEDMLSPAQPLSNASG